MTARFAVLALLLLPALFGVTWAPSGPAGAILPPVNRPPVAVITSPMDAADNSRYETGEPILFSAEDSSDPDGMMVSYRWVISGDRYTPEVFNDMSFHKTFPDKFSTNQYLEVNLTVFDDDGLDSSRLIHIAVGHVWYSHAEQIVVSPVEGTTYDVGEPVLLKADYKQGMVTDVIWEITEFLGSGWNTTVHGISTSFSFPVKGKYIANLTLIILDEKTARAGCCFRVGVAPNQPPVAVIDYPKEGFTCRYMTWDLGATSSFDPDGYVKEANWTLVDGANRTHHFSGLLVAIDCWLDTPGPVRITLRLTDDEGASAWAWTNGTILEDHPPAAVISGPASGSSFRVGEEVNFSAEGSFDPEGGNLSYEWNVGNGTSGDGAPNWTKTFTEPGNYTVTLRVADGWASNITSIEITIRAGPVDPVEPVEPTVPPVKHLNATIFGPERPVLAGASARLAASGAPGLVNLTFHWDLGDGTTAEGPLVEHAYAAPGTYIVTCTARMGSNCETVSLVVEVRAHPGAPVAAPGGPPYLLISVSALVLLGAAVFLGATEVGLSALFPLIVLLYSRVSGERTLDNFTRGKIIGYIIANPGDHYSSIRTALDLNTGTLVYHLNKLEDEKFIKSRTVGVYKRYYPFEASVPASPDGGLGEVQRMILAKVLETPGITQTDIVHILKLSNATISYHMGVLVSRGLVSRKRSGVRMRYFVIPPPVPQGAAPDRIGKGTGSR